MSSRTAALGLLILLAVGSVSPCLALWAGPDIPGPGIPAAPSPRRASDAGLLDAVTDLSTGKTVLSADSRPDLVRQFDALSYWLRASGGTPPDAPLIRSADGRWTAEAQEYLPARPRLLIGRKTRRNGPNCWNTVLFIARMARRPRFSGAHEMSFWMSSPYCRQLTIRETPRPGDIIAMRAAARTNPGEGAGTEELHGMVFLSPELAFSKNTSRKDDRYAIQRAPLVYQSFHFVSADCEFAEGTPDNCLTWANYYRCSDPEADRLAACSSSPGLDEAARKFSLLEDRLSLVVMDSGGADEDIAPLLKELDTLDADTGAYAAAAAGEKERFFFRALLEAIHSAREQIRMGWKL